MKTTEWECIMEQHHGAEWTLINFKALYRWQERRIADLSEGTFGDLAQALTIMNDADHYLCQIFREKTNLLDIAEPEWQKSPSDDVLYKLSQQIGNCALHLCIELELDCNKYEAAIVRFPKDLYSQILDIMKMWKQKYPTATQLRLMQAIQRVSPRGLLILRNST